MGKHEPSIEWQVTENDAEWKRLCAPSIPHRLPARHRIRWSVFALLLLLMGISDWVARTGEPGRHPVAPVSKVSVQTEVGAAEPVSAGLIPHRIDDQTALDWKREGDFLRSTLLTDEPAGRLTVNYQLVAQQGDQAVFNIVITGSYQPHALRQTRFYQRIASGWLRTTPDAALWGSERSLATPFFVYHFRQHDAPAVLAVAPQVDRLYTNLRRNFGLPITSSTEPLNIDVSVTQPPGQASFWLRASHPFSMASPAVYLAPIEVTDAELLAQAITLALLTQVAAQARQRHAIGRAWQPLLDGLYLWQVWQLPLPLAAWGKDIVKWIYVELPTTRPGQPVVLPARYTALCAAHQLWMTSPMQLQIPLLCTALDRSGGSLSGWNPAAFPRQLAHLPVLPPAQEDIPHLDDERAHHPGLSVALATLVEYAVVTYGRDRLPTLVAGLGQHDSWDTLIPAVFGISPTAFEQGWQVYLATYYGIAPAIFRP